MRSDPQELRKEAMQCSDMCCEIKESLMRLSEELDSMTPSERDTEKGMALEKGMKDLALRRRELMDRIEEINEKL